MANKIKIGDKLQVTQFVEVIAKEHKNGKELLLCSKSNGGNVYMTEALINRDGKNISNMESNKIRTFENRRALLKSFQEELPSMHNNLVSITFFKQPKFNEVYKNAKNGVYKTQEAFKNAVKYGEERIMTGLLLIDKHGNFIKKDGYLQIVEFGKDSPRPINERNIISYTFTHKNILK